MGIWFKLLWIALRFVIFLSENFDPKNLFFFFLNFGGAVFANIYKHLHDAYLFLCEEELFKWASCVKKKKYIQSF